MAGGTKIEFVCGDCGEYTVNRIPAARKRAGCLNCGEVTTFVPSNPKDYQIHK